MSVLVIVAHPDDESLFMGGTIARLTQAGERVQVVALSDGVGSRFRWWQRLAWGEARGVRKDAFRLACNALGAEGRIVELFPDQRADSLQQLDLNRKVAPIVEAAKPYVVYTHFLGDGNQDHRMVADAVMTATRPGCVRYVRQVFSIAPEFVERAHAKWKPTRADLLDEDSHRAKMQACYHYARELRPDPHPRSWRAICENATERFMEIR